MRRSLSQVILCCTFSFCVCFIPEVTSAEIIRGIDIDFVTIGNPGNLGDTRAEANPNDCGAVDYEYRIGKYEVTNGQWDAFVATAGAPAGIPSEAYGESAYWTGENIPTNHVSWYEAAQFCNYLTSGDKSQGAYIFNGNNSNAGDFLRIDRDKAILAYKTVYVIPTEDEWYKAAYYSVSGYSMYANGTDIAPIAGVDSNYNQEYPYDGPWTVGNGSEEINGTYDMMGNVWEWNETIIFDSVRGIRAGAFYDFSADYYLSSSPNIRYYEDMYCESEPVGFRIAAIPEPCTLTLLAVGGIGLLSKRRAQDFRKD